MLPCIFYADPLLTEDYSAVLSLAEAINHRKKAPQAFVFLWATRSANSLADECADDSDNHQQPDSGFPTDPENPAISEKRGVQARQILQSFFPCFPTTQGILYQAVKAAD